MREIDLIRYPSGVEFTHKVEDLVKGESINDIATVGRILGNSEQGFVLYHNGSYIPLNFPGNPPLEVGGVVRIFGDYKIINGPEINVKNVSLCSKNSRDLPRTDDVPEKYGGLRLLLDKEKRETITLRSRVLKEVRSFLESRGFLEVETPILQYYPDSAPIPTFSTKDDQTGHEYHLRICPEEYLKRLTLGLDRVYEIAKCFRNSEKSARHSPEFTMLEFHGSFLTHKDMMNLTEELFESVALKIKGSTMFSFGEHEIDLKRPWERISVREAGLKFYGFDPLNKSKKELQDFLAITEDLSIDRLLTIFIESKLESKFIQPTFLTNFPLGVGVPDKPDVNDKATRERAEAFIARGFELANLGSINNDPDFLRNHNTQNLINKFGLERVAQYLDQDFLFEMEYGLPPLACCGIGIDRLVMLLSNKTNINDTIVYPFRI